MRSKNLVALTVVQAAILVAALVAVAGAGRADAAPGQSPKVWVCKYVHAPGVDTEVLKPGKQPIAVNSSATVGDLFNDAQGRSLVVDLVTADNTSRPGNAYTGTFSCPLSPGHGSDEDPDDGINLN